MYRHIPVLFTCVINVVDILLLPDILSVFYGFRFNIDYEYYMYIYPSDDIKVFLFILSRVTIPYP